jgi:cytidylate kinase
VDSVAYGQNGDWPYAADGYGRSVERISLDLPGDDPANWAPSSLTSAAFQHLTGEGGPGQGLGFKFITAETVEQTISERYQLDYSLTGDISRVPKDSHTSKVFANIISATLSDMAVLDDVVVLECGSQFIFRSFPNALHVRVLAPRDTRARNIMQAAGNSADEAIRSMEEQDVRHARFLRSTFRRPSESPERYDLVISTGSFDVAEAVELVIHAAILKKLTEFGMVSSETVERMKLRNQIRLLKALTRLSLDRDEPLKQFAHPSELVFARLLDFYGIRWEYEPRTFPLRTDENGTILEAFSPDFYLPDSNLYVELTTMKQALVTKKNRKIRRLKELYPDVQIRLLYAKDFEDLIFKYSARPTGNP